MRIIEMTVAELIKQLQKVPNTNDTEVKYHHDVSSFDEDNGYEISSWIEYEAIECVKVHDNFVSIGAF